MSDPRPLTPAELAQRWKCTAAEIRRLCSAWAEGDKDGLPHFRVGREYRIPLHVVEGIERCAPDNPGSNSTAANGTPSGAAPEPPAAPPFVPRII